MKKFTKISLIIVACLLFLAILFLGLGYVVGGKNITTEVANGVKESMFKSTKIKIKNKELGNIDFGDWSNSLSLVFDGILEPTEIASNDEINKVICKVGACTFEIKESSNDMYMIESTRMGKFRCYQENDVLYFEGVNERRFTSNIIGKIVLYIPKDADLELFEVQAGACDLKIDKIQASQVKFEIGAGQVFVNKIIAEKCICEIGAGKMEIQSVDADTYIGEIGVGEVTIKDIIASLVETNVGMGSAVFGMLTSDDFSVACAMGNIEATMNGSEDEYQYFASCIAGNVSIGKDGGVIIGTASNASNNLDVDKKIKAECAMGNIKIRFSK